MFFCRIKKVLVLILIILSLFLLFNYVFAVDFSEFPDFPEYYYQNQCDHYFIFYDHSNDKYTLVFWAGTSAIEKNGYIYPGVTNNSYFGGSYEISSSSLANGGSWGGYSHPDAPRGYYYNHNSNRDYLYSNDNIYYEDGTVFMSANVFNKVAPFITNEVGSIENWNFDSFEFDSGEYSYFDNVSVKFYYSIDNTNWQQAEIFSLDTESDYVVRDDPFSETFTANIPRSEIFKNFSLKTGDYIGFEIFYNNQRDYYGPYQLTISNSSSGSGSGSNTSVQDYTNQFSNLQNSINGTTQAIESQTNVINNQTTKIEEQTTVNRGIWGTLQSVLNFINPFSEDFFVYKLIDLLVNALKSLFVPSDGFFNNWLSDLNTYFGDVFGILYYPFEILIDFFTRIGNIQSTEPIINIPRFELNFMGYSAVLFDSFSYNFNDLLVSDTFRNIHTIYLSVVDIILWLGVVYLASKCLQSIFGGMSDVVIDDSLEGERSYQAYSRYENNKQRYKNEHK